MSRNPASKFFSITLCGLMLLSCGSNEPKAETETFSLMFLDESSSETIIPSQALVNQFLKACDLTQFIHEKINSVQKVSSAGWLIETVVTNSVSDFHPTQSFDLPAVGGFTVTGKEFISLIQSLEQNKAGWIDAIYKYDAHWGHSTQQAKFEVEVFISRSSSKATISCEERSVTYEAPRGAG